MNNQGGEWKEWSRHVLIEIQRLSDRQEKMSDTLTENTKQLEIHIEGVKLAREQNTLLRADLDNKIQKVSDGMEPLEAHVAYINGAIKVWGKIGAVVIGVPACIYYCISIYLKLKSGQ